MQQRSITLIIPIAHDLAYDRSTGIVVCGPGTKRACDHALELAKQLDNTHLFVSATNAPRFEDVVMGMVMKKYLQERTEQLVAFRAAPYFNTLGEVLAVVDYIYELQALNGPGAVTKVLFAVKGWHAERVRALSVAVFDQYELGGIRRCIRTHDAPGGFIEKQLEPYKTRRQLRFFYNEHVVRHPSLVPVS